jgi:hypothetical protein
VSVLVEVVVGDFHLVEGDGLLHPMAAGSRGVGVDVQPSWQVGFRLKKKKTIQFNSIQLSYFI